jgi:tetratricopeptide (TPR) repeat protein
MSRRCISGLWVAFAVAGMLSGQDRPTLKQPDTSQEPQGDVQLPPEEDKAQIPKDYSFNPLQSKKEVTVGEFYFKKGDFKAAGGRFREATKWNEGNAEAWLRLGETSEKAKDLKSAREAYMKYLELAPDAKNAPEVKKRLEKLRG